MKKFISIIILILLTIDISAQITTRKVAEVEIEDKKTPYDSTKNFLSEDVYKYIGQEFYLKGMPKSQQKYGYENFLNDYKKSEFDKSNIYKCLSDNYKSSYEELVGKYFKVLDVVKYPKHKGVLSEEEANKYIQDEYLSKHLCYTYLKLQEKESNKIVYFKYNAEFEHSFPFIVAGYFEKLKQTKIGNEYIINQSSFNDINTGTKIHNNIMNTKWQCIDVAILEDTYNVELILENHKKEQISIEAKDYIFNSDKIRLPIMINYNDAEKYKKKYGVENWKLILNRKIKIGMTKEMCSLSWGEPQRINETITQYSKREQWVYEDNYLYFENEQLTAIQ
jgi:hypothetical protein